MDHARALGEARRVLRPGGRVVVGEIVLDPHVVTPGALRRRGEAAGLRWVARHGSALAYFGELVRPG